MFKLTLKNIWSRKGRLLLTAAAVIAGTAFLSGVFVFTDTIKGSFDRIFTSAYANTDAFVRSSNVVEGQFGEETRARIDGGLLSVVQQVPGVVEVEGGVQSNAAMATADGEVVGIDGPPKYGGVFTGSEASPWRLSEGRAPAGPTEVVIDKGSAKRSKIKVGDTVSITTTGQPRDFTVVGIAKFAGNDSSGGATWALFDLATAQEFVIGDPGKLDSISIRGDGNESEQELADRVQAAIDNPEIEVLTGKEITDDSKSQIETSLSFITLFLSIFALISLFVGSFIIYNVFSISAAQRQRENALLRAIGASQSQVTRSLFVEAIVVGIGGSIIGCVGGVGLAKAIFWILEKAGFGFSGATLEIRPQGFVLTMIAGTVVTLLCAIAPALRSGRVPPLAAMRDVSVDSADTSRRRLVLGAVVLAVAAGAIGLGLTGDAIWLGVGVVGLFIALIALGPLVAGPIARMATAPLAKLRGAPGTMAGRNASRNPKRTALTAGALGVGLALLIGVATVGSSAKASLRQAIGDGFTGDYAISSEQQNTLLPAQLAVDINGLGVGDALGIGLTAFKLEEDGTFNDKAVVAVDPKYAAEIFTIPFVSGSFASLTPDGILYAKDKADRDDIAVGDVVNVTLIDGSARSLTVQGIFDDNTVGNLIVDRSIFDGTGLPTNDFGVFVQRADGVNEADATKAIEALVDTYPTAKFQTREQYIDEQSSSIDGFLNFIYALLLMSVFIAVLGIVITLMLAVYERRRELGLIRAVGMTRKQVRGSVLWESLITAIVGATMGTALGVSLGWIVVKALADQGLEVFELPVTSVIAFIVLAIVFAALAAFLPARRAANADVLSAIATT